MTAEIEPDRVAAIAAAARIPLAREDAKRIARAVTPTAARFAAAPIDLPLETGPPSFVVLQRRGGRGGKSKIPPTGSRPPHPEGQPPTPPPHLTPSPPSPSHT